MKRAPETVWLMLKFLPVAALLLAIIVWQELKNKISGKRNDNLPSMFDGPES